MRVYWRAVAVHADHCPVRESRIDAREDARQARRRDGEEWRVYGYETRIGALNASVRHVVGRCGRIA